MEHSRSEIARFREQQALREQAAQQGLSGLAVVASHEAINARMEWGAERVLRLVRAGKREEALALMSDDALYEDESDKETAHA